MVQLQSSHDQPVCTPVRTAIVRTRSRLRESFFTAGAAVFGEFESLCIAVR